MLLHIRQGNESSGLRSPRTIRYGREKKTPVVINHTDSTATETHTVVGTVVTPTTVAGTITDVSIPLTWTQPSGSTYAIASYNIYVDDVLDGTSTTAAYEVTELTPETEYDFTVEAVDAGGTVSAVSEALTETTEAS